MSGYVLAAALLAGMLGLAGCMRDCGCGGGASLAELVEVHGAGIERDFASSVGSWERAEVGARFALGDGVRSGPKAAALLQLEDGATVRLRPSALLRFLAAKPGSAERGLDVQMGEAEISAGRSELRVRTQLGVAVLPPGSRVSLRRSGQERIVYRVELGSARLERPGGGAPELLRQGETVEVGIGMAILERSSVAQQVAAALPPVKPAAEAESTPVGLAEPAVEEAAAALPVAALNAAIEPGLLLPEGPAHASVSAALGESFTLHAARLPLAVSFDAAGRCPEQVALLLDGTPRARGSAQVSAQIAAGKHAYELRCLSASGVLADAALATGNITAVRDKGSASLPARAATAYVDADGKTYTVVYQNLLPQIVLSWPAAPASASYGVVVESAGKTRTLPARKPEQSFAPGAFGEGKHKLRFETPAGESSKLTTLEIRFDNAAPKASLSAPKEGGFVAGASVAVVGVTLPGSEVSVQGGTLELDTQHRFTGSAVTSAERPDLALRISSPRAGIHYYVRRAAGSR